MSRPAIANERLTLNRAGEVVLQLKSPYHDGTTHIVMSPLEFLQRRLDCHLAASEDVAHPLRRFGSLIGNYVSAASKPAIGKQPDRLRRHSSENERHEMPSFRAFYPNA